MTKSISNEKSLLLDRDGPVATLTLNRPESRNALTLSQLDELAAMIGGLSRDPDCRVLVIRGSGTKAFSAGFDIGAITQTSDIAEDGSVAADRRLDAAFRAIEEAHFPVIAAIHGFCIGGGFELALACDLRVVAEDAEFRMPPAQLGWVYGLSNLARFVSILGASRARQVFLTGESIDARTALDWGIAHDVRPKAELDDRVAQMTSRLTGSAPIALAGLKQGIAALASAHVSAKDRQRHVDWRRRAFMSSDLAEGRAAFLERRKPRFTGA
jgi:enoyl-CoA hydratase/carnithine racemase